MKNIFILYALHLFIFSAFAANSMTSDSSQSNLLDNSQTESDSKYFIPKKCNVTTSKNNSCDNTNSSGCVCYNNGTCRYMKDMNSCNICHETDIVSFNEGEQCPDLGDLSLSVCTQGAGIRNCPMIPSPIPTSCVCFENGTCAEQQTVACLACGGSGVVSVLNEGNCSLLAESNKRDSSQNNPMDNSQTKSDSKYFIPKKCNATTSKNNSCDNTNSSGCVCYNNGTCHYMTDMNSCNMCHEADVVSFNEGEQCPHLEDYRLSVCMQGAGIRNCPMIPSPIPTSCVCFENGTCAEQQTVACLACGGSDVVSVLNEGNCNLLAESDMRSPCKNNDGAYVCTAKDRRVRPCSEVLPKNGCVCYSDGTCRSLPANQCSFCKNKDVVSVYEGENCTNTCSQ